MKRLCILLGFTWLTMAACESQAERDRCARCGMYTDLDTSFAAHRGDTPYDTPKCLWKDLVEGKGRAKDAQVTEYYGQQSIPADRALYVVGSDVLGPMGPDLIPIEGPERAEQFASEHGGRVVDASQIDGALLDSL